MTEKDINKRLDPAGQEFYDISQQIQGLSNELAEEVVLDALENHMRKDIDFFTRRPNYVSLFRKKYTEITEELLQYDKSYVRNSLTNLSNRVNELMDEKYGVRLGTDVDFYFPDEYLKDAETIYEFLFIRHAENLEDYFFHMFQKNRRYLINRYESLLKEEVHSNDKFVINNKKRLKDKDDVVVLQFLGEMIDDIKDMSEDGLSLFNTIISIEPDEEFNVRMFELLELYGAKIIFSGNTDTYEKYMKPLSTDDGWMRIRNHVWSRIMEEIEVNPYE